MQDAAWDGAADLRARLEPQPRSWIVIATMAFGTLGIIYGDIGTSPLYTFAGIFSGVDNTDADDAKMGLSLIFWTLTLVVMIKYVLIVLRADDNGEGGTFALYSRLCRSMGLSPFGTLQAQEHEQLVTISKRGPPPVPASARINRPSRSLMRNHTPSSRFQPMSSGPQRLTSADSTSVPLGQAPGATPALTGAPSPLVTLSRLGGGMHLNPQAVLPEDASYCEALDQGRMALRPPATQAALDKMESCESGEASGRKQQEGPVSAKDVGVRIPSTSALVGMPEVARTPRHWWSRGALPAEAFKRWVRGSVFAQRTLLVISISATSLVLGDGVLTPAVSVVSAISGLTVATNVTQEMVVGISIAILVVLFSLQHYGTDRISFVFSPVVALWLASNAAIGIYNLATNGLQVLEGLSPYWIGAFFQRYRGATGWQMLGSVMLAVSGAEALFADLGHFNVASITLSWTTYVYPCLVLTYIGQASHLINTPEDMSNLYWQAVPRLVFWPMLVLATLASIVASQALISAAFSICSQARALGCFPKVLVVNTSPCEAGQIYVPFVNYTLMWLTVAVIAGFQGNSVHLGNAYGLTISAVMFITTIYIVLLAIVDWQINFLAVMLFGVVYGIIDGVFFSANLTKVPKGGWVALAIGGGVATVNLTWWWGQRRRRHVLAKLERQTMDAQPFTYVTRPGAVGGSASSSLPPAPHMLNSHTTYVSAPSFGAPASPSAADAAARAFSLHPLVLANQPSDPLTAWHNQAAAAAAPHMPILQHDGALGGALQPQLSLLSHYLSLGNILPNALDLGMLRGDLTLALKQPRSASASPLVILPGIALHYSDDSSSAISAVLRHVINNQEAIHEVNVLVAVRRLPVPRICEDDRLLVRTLAQLPMFYQVVARYGYLDKVDHGPDFINALVGAVVTVLADNAGMHEVKKTQLDAVVDVLPAAAGHEPMATQVMDVHSLGHEGFRSPNPSLATLSRTRRFSSFHNTTNNSNHNTVVSVARAISHLMEVALPPQRSHQADPTLVSSLVRRESGAPVVDIQLTSPAPEQFTSTRDHHPMLATHSMPVGTQRMSLNLATLSRTVQHSHLGHTLSRTTAYRLLGHLPTTRSGDMAAGAPGGPTTTPFEGSVTSAATTMEQQQEQQQPTGAVVGDLVVHLCQMATVAQNGGSLPPEMEEAALRVAALLKAASSGCVYYFSRASLRMDPRNNILCRILMEQLFRPMLLLAYADHEEWHVPLEFLVELGMAIRL